MRRALALIALTAGCSAIAPVRLRCETTRDCVGFNAAGQPDTCFTHTCVQGECVAVGEAPIAPDCLDNDCDGFIDEVSEHPTGTPAANLDVPVPWGAAAGTRLSAGDEGWAAAPSGTGLRVHELSSRDAPRELEPVTNDRPDMLARPSAPGCWSALTSDDPMGPDAGFCPPDGVAVGGGEGWVAFVAGARCAGGAFGYDLRVGLTSEEGLAVRGEDGASTTFRGVRPSGCGACADTNACRPDEPRLAPRGDAASLAFLSGPVSRGCGDGEVRSAELLELFLQRPGGRAFVTGADGGVPTALGATRTTGGVGVARGADGTYVAYEDDAAMLQLRFVPAVAPPLCAELASCAPTVSSRAPRDVASVPVGDGTHDLSLALVESPDSSRSFLLAAWVAGCARPTYAAFELDVSDRAAPGLVAASGALTLEGATASDHVSTHGLSAGVITDAIADAELDASVRYGGFAIGWVDSDRRAMVAIVDLRGSASPGATTFVAEEAADVTVFGRSGLAAAWLADGSLVQRSLSCVD